MKKVDLTGQTFGMLKAEHPERLPNGKLMWRCTCKCGQTILARGYDLMHGVKVSCGCTHRETLVEVSAEYVESGVTRGDRVIRKGHVRPKLPINGVFATMQPEDKVYQADIVTSKQPGVKKPFAVIQLDNSGKKPLVLRAGEYREVKQDYAKSC